MPIYSLAYCVVEEIHTLPNNCQGCIENQLHTVCDWQSMCMLIFTSTSGVHGFIYTRIIFMLPVLAHKMKQKQRKRIKLL